MEPWHAFIYFIMKHKMEKYFKWFTFDLFERQNWRMLEQDKICLQKFLSFIKLTGPALCLVLSQRQLCHSLPWVSVPGFCDAPPCSSVANATQVIFTCSAIVIPCHSSVIFCLAFLPFLNIRAKATAKRQWLSPRLSPGSESSSISLSTSWRKLGNWIKVLDLPCL